LIFKFYFFKIAPEVMGVKKMKTNKITSLNHLFISFLLILISADLIQSQTQEWIGFTSGKIIFSLADEGQYLWVGKAGSGLVKLNKSTGEFIVYDKWNSQLPDNFVNAIAIDGQGNKWIGTYGEGLAKFDGVNWTVYKTSNSGLPDNRIWTIAIDGQGNKWIGTWGGGLAKFGGVNWTVYNTSNSGLPDNYVWAIAIDGQGNKWIGTGGGLAKFDGVNWTVYNTSNSRLPSNAVYAIAIDGQGNKWIGTRGGLTNGGLAKFDGVNWTVYNTSNSGLPDNWVLAIAIDGGGNKWIGTYGGGLAKFDGVNWTVYKTSNSGLPDNYVLAIAIDGQGNKWIGTDGGGLAVYREGGVIIPPVEVKNESNEIPKKFSLYQNYPNPFNPTTTIEFDIPERTNVKLTIYDILGREVETLIDKELEPGKYKINFNATNLPSGVYFYTLKTPKSIQTKKMLLIK
jgi:ligand-binding sensor domain-containing protein